MNALTLATRLLELVKESGDVDLEVAVKHEYTGRLKLERVTLAHDVAGHPSGILLDVDASE